MNHNIKITKSVYEYFEVKENNGFASLFKKIFTNPHNILEILCAVQVMVNKTKKIKNNFMILTITLAIIPAVQQQVICDQLFIFNF